MTRRFWTGRGRRPDAGRILRGLAAAAGLALGAAGACAAGTGSERAGAALAVAAEPLLWTEDGRPTAVAHEAVALLADAAREGLEPADYGAAGLQRAVAAAAEGAVREPAELARLDADLSRAMQRLLADVHRGRLDPRALAAPFDAAWAGGFDPAAVLRQALAARHLADALRAAAPAWPQYAELRGVLAAYRAMGAHPAWRQRLPALPGRSLEPAQAWPGLAVLAQRLQALGDLDAAAPVPGRYEGALVEALRAFQQRHGLEADGRLGRATLAALEVAPAERARQVALTMERLRWTPPPDAPRAIVVNLPAFTLHGLQRRADGPGLDEVLTMKVIVGNAKDTPTPLLHESLRFIEFSPNWNVPVSVARGELVPRLQRDPAYFEQQGFELVARDGSSGTPLGAAALEAVLRGELRLRQRPGPTNALGDIKFVFPNAEAIFMHHTPTVGLFGRVRRDFSHGCIRVQEPVALARFVLADDPAWTEPRIREAMGARSSKTIRLEQPLPVLITYLGVQVRQGRPQFFDDFYGLDRALAAAPRRRGDV